MLNFLFQIKQRWITAFYRSRFLTWVYQVISFTKMVFRKLVGLVWPTSSTKNVPNPTDRYESEYSNLPGWFLPEAIAVWKCILDFQNRTGVSGRMLEIGIWKAKSAACSAVYSKPNEECFFVDRVVLAEAKATIRSIRHSNNVFIQQPSSELPMDARFDGLDNSFRWIHIDGEHSGQAVAADLKFCSKLLGPGGVICVDDFPSNSYPQIYFSVIQFLLDHPELKLFATGHNKGYICRDQDLRTFLTFFRDEIQLELAKLGAEVTIWKSGKEGDLNCFGITNRVEQFQYRGPDWDTLKIDIHDSVGRAS